MPKSTESGPQVEVPSEIERAKATFVNGLSTELQGFFRSSQNPEVIASFISNTVADRIGRNSELSPETLTELFEGMPSMHDINVHMDKDANSTQIFSNKKTTLAPELQQLAYEEMIRVQLLMRGADSEFKGNAYKKNDTTNGEAPRLSDWLKIYGALRSDAKNSVYSKENRLHISTPKKSNAELMATAYDKDPELFGDLMVAYGVREGALRKNSSLNDAWRNMQDPGYKPYGVTVVLSEEGIPYRPEKRQEDIKMVLESAGRLGQESKVQTYKDLQHKVGELETKNKNLTEENRRLRKSITELEGQFATTQSELGGRNEAVGEKDEMANRVMALEARIQELLAIAEEKVGTFSRDTRANRMRQLAESPLPDKK